MSNSKYSDDFKLQVINEYFNGELGCRLLAKKYNLPSKNYITNWQNQLIKKSLLSHKPKKISHKGGKVHDLSNKKTPYEKKLERENFELKAELAYLNELKKLLDNDKKK